MFFCVRCRRCWRWDNIYTLFSNNWHFSRVKCIWFGTTEMWKVLPPLSTYLPWKWRQYAPPKCRSRFLKPLVVTLHNTIKQHSTPTKPKNFMKRMNQIKKLAAKVYLVVIRKILHSLILLNCCTPDDFMHCNEKRGRRCACIRWGEHEH